MRSIAIAFILVKKFTMKNLEIFSSAGTRHIDESLELQVLRADDVCANAEREGNRRLASLLRERISRDTEARRQLESNIAINSPINKGPTPRNEPGVTARRESCTPKDELASALRFQQPIPRVDAHAYGNGYRAASFPRASSPEARRGEAHAPDSKLTRPFFSFNIPFLQATPRKEFVSAGQAAILQGPTHATFASEQKDVGFQDREHWLRKSGVQQTQDWARPSVPTQRAGGGDALLANLQEAHSRVELLTTIQRNLEAALEEERHRRISRDAEVRDLQRERKVYAAQCASLEAEIVRIQVEVGGNPRSVLTATALQVDLSCAASYPVVSAFRIKPASLHSLRCRLDVFSFESVRSLCNCDFIHAYPESSEKPHLVPEYRVSSERCDV